MSNADQDSWSRVKERLRADVGDDVYTSWFARMDLEALNDKTVQLSVPTRFLKNWIQSHYAERVLACWQAHVTDVARFKPYLTGLGVIAAARRVGGRAFAWRRPPYEFERRLLPIDILCGTDTIRRALERGRPLAEIERAWAPGLAAWTRRRAHFLLYR